jgi:hypothetical protein
LKEKKEVKSEIDMVTAYANPVEIDVCAVKTIEEQNAS